MRVGGYLFFDVWAVCVYDWTVVATSRGGFFRVFHLSTLLDCSRSGTTRGRPMTRIYTASVDYKTSLGRPGAVNSGAGGIEWERLYEGGTKENGIFR